MTQSNMSIESWKTFFDVGAVVLLFLTFAFGAGALLTGNVISKRSEAQSRKLEQDLTEAKTKLGEVEKSAADAETNAAEAKVMQHRVEIDLAKQQERAARAEMAFLKLKQQTEPRRVNTEQRQNFLAMFKAERESSIGVVPQGGVSDAKDFGRDLVSLFRQAGFSVDDSHIEIFTRVGGLGSNIELSAGTRRLAEAEELAKALVNADIVKPPIQIIPSNPPDSLVLYIGDRPN